LRLKDTCVNEKLRCECNAAAAQDRARHEPKNGGRYADLSEARDAPQTVGIPQCSQLRKLQAVDEDEMKSK
jgi:hypothetical protein